MILIDNILSRHEAEHARRQLNIGLLTPIAGPSQAAEKVPKQSCLSRFAPLLRIALSQAKGLTVNFAKHLALLCNQQLRFFAALRMTGSQYFSVSLLEAS